MAASDNGSSGGILRGHGVAFALVAIFVGMALVVAYAASNGAIFGTGSDSATGGELPATDEQVGAVISRDSFDEPDSVPTTRDANSTLSEEQRRLLDISEFSWDSVAGRNITSNQDLMDRLREPVSVQPGTEPLSISDAVLASVSRDRNIDETEIADILDIPVELGDEEAQDDAEDEQERPQDDEDQDTGDGQNNDNPFDEEPSDDSVPVGGNDTSGSGNGTSGNSTGNEVPAESSGSGSGDDNSTDAEITVSID